MCSRGCTHVHLNTEVHGTSWGDAADRAAGLVYYKVTRAVISCEGSQSLGFSLDDLLILPHYLSSIEIVSTVRGLPHLTRRRNHGDFRPYHRSGGHRDHDGGHCTWRLCCSCATLYTHCYCAKSGLGRCDHMCWLREFFETMTCLVLLLTLPRSSASHIPSPLAREVSACRTPGCVDFANILFSRIWHGPALLES